MRGNWWRDGDPIVNRDWSPFRKLQVHVWSFGGNDVVVTITNRNDRSVVGMPFSPKVARQLARKLTEAADAAEREAA